MRSDSECRLLIKQAPDFVDAHANGTWTSNSEAKAPHCTIPKQSGLKTVDLWDTGLAIELSAHGLSIETSPGAGPAPHGDRLRMGTAGHLLRKTIRG